ncbi:hypothetical protein BUALT_Bualt03G0221200 [Buddleja alternifolia]|uniref:Protein kinase domain-containing protein n=1 Tax=Buddleja alternifolia TaxID=168488 RepID=A0AAV6XX99_9LAMI|nr:hypothetical protein BUALT_Bualt03G0221200 [Buddleja alternifolia]
MVKLCGYCLEGDHLVVYDFKSFDSIYNLIPKDGFTWLQRIRVAMRFAILLKFLHTRKSSFYKPFIVRNLNVTHLVLDEDYNPKICDFGLITGGVFPDRTIFKHHHVIGCYGYIDSCAFYAGDFSDKIDVFGFGAILLSLITKRVYTEEERLRSAPFVFKLALNEYEEYEYGSESETEVNRPKFSVVHQSLAGEPGYCPDDGHKLSMIGVECVIGLGSKRPNMKQILNICSNLMSSRNMPTILE